MSEATKEKSPSLTDLLQSHIPNNSLPNANIHPHFLKTFSEFGEKCNGDNISFRTILEHWSQADNIQFTDLKYDHDLYLYHMASTFKIFGLWKEMADLIVMGSFFHQVRQSGGIEKLSNDSQHVNKADDDTIFPIYFEASRLPHEKEAIQKYLAKYLPKNENKINSNFAIPNKASPKISNKTGIVAKYRDDMTALTLNLSQKENMSMKQLIKKLARDVDVSLKSVRTFLNDKPILLSEVGHKTPKDLSIQNGDVINFVDFNNKQGHSDCVGKNKTKKGKSKNKNNNATANRKKKNKGIGTRRRTPLSLHHENNGNMKNTENLQEQSRLEHSRNLSKIFEEAADQFKAIRTNLNNLSLKNSQPKSVVGTRRKETKRSKDLTCVSVDKVKVDFVGTCGKAGKVAYTVRIGEVTHLYKSRKVSQNKCGASSTKKECPSSYEIDLHRMTRDEARMKLDEMLPKWVRAAMESSYPWVVKVRIVCGGGNQILSEMVQVWIRENECVANVF